MTPGEGENIRFTTTMESFYIHVLGKPNATLDLESPIPWIPGDQVTVVGGKMAGAVVPSEAFGEKGVRLNVSDAIAAADRWAWVFKITY